MHLYNILTNKEQTNIFVEKRERERDKTSIGIILGNMRIFIGNFHTE